MVFGAIFTVRGPNCGSDDQQQNTLKTMIPKRLTVFCKLVIVSFVMGLNKNFKVRVPKCPFDERHQKLGECEDREACDSTLHIGHLFGPNGVQRDFCRKGSKLTL